MSYHRTSELVDGAGETMPVELVCLKSDRTWSIYVVDIPTTTPSNQIESVAFAEADKKYGEANWAIYKDRRISLDAEYL